MKVLYLTPHVPGPTKVRSYYHIQGLRAAGVQVTVATLFRGGPDREQIERLKDNGFVVLAEPINLVRSAQSVLQAVLSRSPLQARLLWSPALLERVQRRLIEQPVDIVHVEHLRMAEFGLHLRAYWPVVWDAVDHLGSLYGQAAAASVSPLWRIAAALETPRLQHFEPYLTSQFPMTLVISPYDQALFQETSSVPDRVKIAPLGIPLNTVPAVVRDPATLIITGTLNYHPNVASVLAFVRDIFPRVRQQVPEARLQLVGANPDRVIRRLNGPDIEVTGFVPSVAEYLARATVALAPVIYGSGTQVKVLEAFAARAPLVATPTALRGLSIHPGEQALVADDAPGLADRIVCLLRDANLRRRVGAAGRAYVEQHHGLPHTTENLLQLYRQIQQPLSSPAHRQ